MGETFHIFTFMHLLLLPKKKQTVLLIAKQFVKLGPEKITRNVYEAMRTYVVFLLLCLKPLTSIGNS